MPEILYSVVKVVITSKFPEGKVVKVVGRGTLEYDGPAWPKFLTDWGKAGNILCGQVANIVGGDTIGFWATFKMA